MILDDNTYRHKIIGSMLERRSHGVMHATTYNEAIQLMQQYHFDGMYLDHDLQEFIRGERVERTGTHVAAFIANELPADKRPKKIVIHSWNKDGAKMMESLLSNLGIVIEIRPFSERWI